MFSNPDRDDFAELARIAGIALFLIALFLPSVTNGYVQSPADYLITRDAYHGWVCAGWTLYGTIAFVGSLLGPDGPNGWAVFFMISGWISPLVVFGILIGSDKAKRVVARIIPVLLLAPWIVFAWPESGWGPGPFRPLIGHYVWTLSCMLIFTPQYLTIFAGRTGTKAPDES